MFGDVVLGVPHEQFEKKLTAMKQKAGVKDDVDLTAEQLEELCEQYVEVYKENGQEFPESPFDQIRACVKAVFGSWNTPRAVKYREIHEMNDLLGTATNVQVR